MPLLSKTEIKLILAARLGRACPTLPAVTVADTVHGLARLAASLHRRYEAACSYQYANTEKYERATERREAKARDLAAKIPGLTVEHQRDPRGWPLILKLDGEEIGRLG